MWHICNSHIWAESRVSGGTVCCMGSYYSEPSKYFYWCNTLMERYFVIVLDNLKRFCKLNFFQHDLPEKLTGSGGTKKQRLKITIFRKLQNMLFLTNIHLFHIITLLCIMFTTTMYIFGAKYCIICVLCKLIFG